MKFEWEEDTRHYHHGKTLRVGKWIVGGVCWDRRHEVAQKHYGAKSMLPGLKDFLDYYETEDEAKKRVEKATTKWLDDLSVWD